MMMMAQRVVLRALAPSAMPPHPSSETRGWAALRPPAAAASSAAAAVPPVDPTALRGPSDSGGRAPPVAERGRGRGRGPRVVA